jgi:hypothetical protein
MTLVSPQKSAVRNAEYVLKLRFSLLFRMELYNATLGSFPGGGMSRVRDTIVLGLVM